MPQKDRHKNRILPIEFIAAESFARLPYPERLTLVFVTAGSINGSLNDRPITVSAPGVLCLGMQDMLQVFDAHGACAQSFCFHPDFLSSVPLSEAQGYVPTNLRIETGLSLFRRDHPRAGVPRVTEKAYPQLFEWFFVLGTEVYAQSDERWACRIKKYLIQILGLLEDLNRQGEPSPVDVVLEYIHTNYTEKITLEELTKCAHLNRVSLNQLFQQRCGHTAMGYLLAHRLKVAGELLTHTDMNLNDIARSTGFGYDTYFIKQFTAKQGMSPTVFRHSTRRFAAAL